jgi:peptide/nickel transport system ATP-binding protein
VVYEGEGVEALRAVDLDLASDERVGVVGESGSGKSTLAAVLLGILPANARVSSTQATWDDRPVFDVRTRLAGGEIGFVVQNPLDSLDPLMTVRSHFREMVGVHLPGERGRVDEIAESLLARLELDPPREMLHRYPFELSGGMRQRLMLALALAAEPKMLILDEPTTALDTVTQRRLLDVVRGLADERGIGLLFITHDLAVLRGITSRLIVVYRGVIVEEGPTERLLSAPSHPYTAALLQCLRDIEEAPERPFSTIPNAELPPPRELCVFLGRCPRSFGRCEREAPGFHPTADGRSRCHLSDPAEWQATA